MKKIMTATELLQTAAKALTSSTMYVKGGFGQLATAKNKAKAIAMYDYNKARAEQINAAPYRTWFFDCLCFIKAILWGWCGNYGDSNGGAKYASNGVPDCTERQLLVMCGENQFTISNKAHLVKGALLYMRGHVGLYAGDGKVIECSPKLGGVRCTEITFQGWTHYGLLECIDYAEDTPTPAPEPVLEKGTKIILNSAPLYASYDTKKVANHMTGYFYLYDGKAFGTRYRIVKNRYDCGAINKVLGYVERKDIKCARS